MSALSWVTNDPEAARKLRAADDKFLRAHREASCLPLAQKVAALRKAKADRQAAYEEVTP